MSETFGAGLPRLHALACQALGWRPGEFWSATPEELASALLDPSFVASPSMSRADIETLLERENHG